MPTNGDLPNNIRQDADDANAQICRYVREQNKLMKIHYTIYRLQGEKGGISSFTGDGEVFDEIVHPWLASARHAQRHQDGHVANDNEDEKDPQESQLLRLIGRKKIVRLFISEPLESEPQRHRRLIASRLPSPIDKRKRRNRTDGHWPASISTSASFGIAGGVGWLSISIHMSRCVRRLSSPLSLSPRKLPTWTRGDPFLPLLVNGILAVKWYYTTLSDWTSRLICREPSHERERGRRSFISCGNNAVHGNVDPIDPHRSAGSDQGNGIKNKIYLDGNISLRSFCCAVVAVGSIIKRIIHFWTSFIYNLLVATRYFIKSTHPSLRRLLSFTSLPSHFHQRESKPHRVNDPRAHKLERWKAKGSIWNWLDLKVNKLS